MKKDWRSLLWCAILVGTTGASEDDSKVDQCKDRLSRYYRSHFEDENELHVPNACQSCCCSNNTNQVHTTYYFTAPDFRPINKFSYGAGYHIKIRKVTHNFLLM